MDILQHYSQTRFMGFVPRIRKEVGEWWVVEVALTGDTDYNVAYIAMKLREYFGGKDGIIFICNNKNILVLAHMGQKMRGDTLAQGIHKKLPRHSCTAQVADATPDGLMKIKLHLDAIEQSGKSQRVSALLNARQNRKERIVMIVDDEALMRALINMAFRTRSQIIEFKDTGGVLESYLRYLPDVVFLDIHLPGGSGIDLLEEILNFDATAHVIILSADSVKGNVVEANKFGAKGFIAKPFTLEKLESYYNKCPTVLLRGMAKACASHTTGA